MKTTVEIADALFEEARRIAARDETSLRELIEDGLRRTLEERSRRRPFRLRRASFNGKGLQPGVAAGSWDVVRELIYDGRGT